jgi:hypothetical protein
MSIPRGESDVAGLLRAALENGDYASADTRRLIFRLTSQVRDPGLSAALHERLFEAIALARHDVKGRVGFPGRFHKMALEVIAEIEAAAQLE